MTGTFAHTADREVFVPEVKITRDDPRFTLLPLRGYSGHLAVFDADDRCIGWLPVELASDGRKVLGCASVQEYCKRLGYPGFRS
jgi:hypothetical protein